MRGRADAALLARFYDELYLPAFHHQREPLAAWEAQLWGEAAPYELAIVLAGHDLDGDARLAGGIASELYPASGCGLLTYLVVAPDARRAGLGRALLDGARRTLAERARARGVALAAVFGEVSDPARGGAEAVARLRRFQRWGARVVDHPYVQPDLGSGRDRALRLIAFAEGTPPPALDGAVLAAFLREFYTLTEGAPLDDELAGLIAAIPAAVPLVAWP